MPRSANTGKTFKQIIQTEKLSRAASLLINTDLPVEQVARDARHQLTDLVAVIKVVGKPLQMGKQVAAHVSFDVRAHHMPNVRHEIVGGGVNNP